jgi:putative transcriptional regulator
MITIRVDDLLMGRGRTFYWLAKQTSISHTTLWRLKKGKAFGINFDTLEKICRTLKCQPGDVLSLTNGKTIAKGPGTKRPSVTHALSVERKRRLKNQL